MTLVVAAFWLQLRLLSRSPFFLSLALATPVAFGTVAVLQTGQAGAASTRVVLGAGLLGAMSTTLFGAAEAILMRRWAGTLEALVASPRGLFRPVLGFSIGTALLGAYSLAAVWAWTVVVFRVEMSGNPWVISIALLTTLAGLSSTGTVLAALYVLTRHAMAITNLAEYPIWIVCGALTPATALWPPLAWLGKTIPVGWSIAALDAQDLSAASVPICISGGLSIAYLCLAAVLLRRVDRLARENGTLALR